MTQEDKELLIKDLCARIPYSMKFKTSNGFDTLDGIVDDEINPTNEFPYDIEEIKPYLFPMSSITEEQKEEYYDIWCREWLDNASKNIEGMGILLTTIDYLNSHHFDYRGLIAKGLAIDATNLNIY